MTVIKMSSLFGVGTGGEGGSYGEDSEDNISYFFVFLFLFYRLRCKNQGSALIQFR